MSNGTDRIVAPTVLTIHGVCPGPWQQTAERVLSPHFTCAAITYPDYDCIRGGAVKAVAHPLLLLAAVGVAGWAAYADARILWYAAAAGLVGAGAWVATRQRHRCAERVKTQISDKSTLSYATHVIAHSFGTYLASRAMRSYDILFDRVVLVGCVLPRRFDWQALFDRRPMSGIPGWLSSELDIRNETGTADRVVWLAGLTTWLTRELGSAGRKGFVAGRHAVHSTADPWHACAACRRTRAQVHNVALNAYRHSTWALGVGHALHLWLPYLWGYPPVEFRDWLNVCSRATRALDTGDKEGFVEAAWLLLRREWAWTRRPDRTPRSLEAYLADQAGSAAGSIRDEFMSRLVHAVRLAQEAAISGTVAHEKIRWRLDPKLAINCTLADIQTPES